jgi:hypothetical protein
MACLVVEVAALFRHLEELMQFSAFAAVAA